MSTYHSVFSIGFEQPTEGMISGRAVSPSFRISSLHQKMSDADRQVFVQLVDNFAEAHLGSRVVPRCDQTAAALALTGYKPQAGEPIQWDRPLYDSDGYQHSLVHLGAVEVVTKHSFTYSVWNRKSGQCLREGCGDISISNTPLAEQERASRKAEGARLLADLHAKAAPLNRIYNMLGLGNASDPGVCEIRSQISSPMMSKDVYLLLHGALESMEQQAAAGQDATEHFQETMELLGSFVDAAVWTMHPDYGCVLASQVDDLDRAAEVGAQRERQ